MQVVGRSLHRKEAYDKVSGRARYVADAPVPGMLHAHLVASPHARARIRRIDPAPALAVPGVRAVITAEDAEGIACGEVLADRPPLARGVARHFGEPVAAVVADCAEAARAGARALRVDYEPLPPVNSIEGALAPDSPRVHEDLAGYTRVQQPVYPENGTNVADRARLRKGDMKRGWKNSAVTVEGSFTVPQFDHAAMETRAVRCEILPDGRVLVQTGSQAPFEVQRTLAKCFGLQQGQVVVQTPFVGGAFGGKAAVQLEPIAYLASRRVGGRCVQIVNPREQDIAGSPVAAGLEATVKLGANRQGRLMAMEVTYRLDIGAYTDSAPRVARAVASACTGPYRVANVRCEVLCVYTNHVYTTAFRGFGYMPLTFAVERALDKLAAALGMDPLLLRERNAVGPGEQLPTRVKLTRGLIGDLPGCIERVRGMIDWRQGRCEELGGGRVRARGAACFWKTSSSPTDAISGAIVTFNKDGGVNLSLGVVECGSATNTGAAQILAERLGIDVGRVQVRMDVDTQVSPEHWKTVASMSTFMAGRAVIAAADDALRQIREVAAVALRCPPADLEVAGERVFLRDDPAMYLPLSDVVHGYKYADGDAVGGQVIGRGAFIMRHLTLLDGETGEGMPGPSWTVGAQAVEVEVDTRSWRYRILRAVTALDAGRIINPETARSAVMGGMCQGLGCASREGILYDADGVVANRQLRSYKVMRAGEQPEYAVAFVETPQANGPYGARPLGEHGILAMPAALANALTAAVGSDLDRLPLTPERLWAARKEHAVACD